MKTIEETIIAFGRFAVGLAIGLALTSAYVIATAVGTDAEPSAGIVVEESLRATAADGEADAGDPAAPPARLHVYGRGAQRV